MCLFVGVVVFISLSSVDFLLLFRLSLANFTPNFLILRCFSHTPFSTHLVYFLLILFFVALVSVASYTPLIPLSVCSYLIPAVFLVLSLCGLSLFLWLTFSSTSPSPHLPLSFQFILSLWLQCPFYSNEHTFSRYLYGIIYPLNSLLQHPSFLL